MSRSNAMVGTSPDADCVTASADGRRIDNFTQPELAERWRLSGRTLEKFRQTGRGPRYLRIGGKVLYPLREVEAYEAAALRGGSGTKCGAVDAEPPE